VPIEGVGGWALIDLAAIGPNTDGELTLILEGSIGSGTLLRRDWSTGGPLDSSPGLLESLSMPRRLIGSLLFIVIALSLGQLSHSSMGGVDTVEELPADDMVAAIEVALDETARSRGAWTAEFVEVTAAHPDDGGAERSRSMGSVLCVGGTGIVEIRGDRATTIVVTDDAYQHRVGEELVRQEAPGTALLTLPVVLPGPVMLRQLGLPSVHQWHRCERHRTGDEVKYTIETALGRGSRFSRYRLGFVVDDGMQNLATVARTTFVREDDGTDRVLSHGELVVESWAAVGRGRLPSVVRRRTEIWEADGRLSARGANRLEVREHQAVVPADAQREIAERLRGGIGEIVRDDRMGVRYVVGGRWIEIDGVRHELAEPIDDLSPDALKRLIEELVGPQTEGDSPAAGAVP